MESGLVPRRYVIGYVCYAALVFAVLFINYRGDPFCHGPGQRQLIWTFASATAMLLGWDNVGRLVGVAVSNLFGKMSPGLRARKLMAAVATTLVVGVGIMSAPFWMYEGYGHFRLENTVADVSCMFTEGYALGFVLVVGPLLTLATLVREVIMHWVIAD